MHRHKPSPSATGACLLFLSCLEGAVLLFTFERQAHAYYVDPGSGFVFLQVAGSMMAGTIFYLRHRLKKLLGFARKTDEMPPSSAGINDEPGTPP